MANHRLDDLAVAIQAGGESKRMGKPKALVTFLGAPLIMRGINRLFPICSEMVITTNEPEKMGFLDSYVSTGRLKLVSDGTDCRGALVGIKTAFASAVLPYVALVACDMVFPSPSLITYLHNKLESTGADIAIPKTKYGYEPFHAVYRRETCLVAVERALGEGELRATSWFDGMRIVEIDHEEVLKVHPRGGVFVNVNTPEELRTLEQRILTDGITSAEEGD